MEREEATTRTTHDGQEETRSLADHIGTIATGAELGAGGVFGAAAAKQALETGGGLFGGDDDEPPSSIIEPPGYKKD